MDNPLLTSTKESWLDRLIFPAFPKFKLEYLLVTVIILLSVISRFYDVGARVMSHDEVNHVVPSYDLYLGKGYSHDPVTHGPLQFHLLAGSYFLFGDSDFSSRIPSALFSIATIVFVLFAFRRYLGRTGALLSGLFFLISPYLLFYGRYTRNESFIGLFSVVLLYIVLYYLEKGKTNSLYIYTATLALYFCTKETSFIFAAEMLIFLAFIFLCDVTRKSWKKPSYRDFFILSMILTLLLVVLALGAGVIDAKSASQAATPTVDGGIAPAAAQSALHIATLILVGFAGIGLVISILFLFIGLGWSTIRNNRAFDLILLTFTLVMPQLIAFPINLLGWNPLDYSDAGMIRTSIVLVITVAVAVLIGLLWKPMTWLKNAGIFYAIFTVFYTTFFTNGQGFFTGMVGSLGYWLSQQSVNRGTQPWYYYAFIQIPMYEYLAALGTLFALYLGFKHRLFTSTPQVSPADQVSLDQAIKAEEAAQKDELLAIIPIESPLHPSNTAHEVAEVSEQSAVIVEDENPKCLPVLTLLLYWSVMSLLAFSVAGEKMPWLTVHIATPMLLAAGFGIGYLVDMLSTQKWNYKHLLSLLVFPIFLISFTQALGLIIGIDKPFAGKELAQLRTTSTFVFSLIAFILSGWGIFRLTVGMKIRNILKMLVITFFGILTVLTARSAFQANYINYDTGKEFLVYAHSARGPKDVLEQVEDISYRTTGGKNIKVAYIGDALYPYWWYFRDYPNKIWYKEKLTRELADYPVIISDDTEIDKVRAILDDDYYEFKYKRMLWPMQNYMNQSVKTVWTSLKDPQMIKAITDIWLNKDYTLYSQIKGISSLTLETWEPSQNIYLLIKKDIVASIWSYGVVPEQAPAEVDPYAEKMIELTPDLFIGSAGSAEGQFNNAHGIAIGSNGDIYVADARNHRIQRFSADGQYISTWGTYASVANGNAPGGTFNEPWGIATGPDGSVYVTDTWNYRVQKFTAEGEFLTMWGTSGTADSPTTFWGPRGIVVNQQGKVFITDTGNNRVVVFDEDGEYLTQFGVNGIGAGEFDEPVGLAIDDEDNIYVVDTWNKRIQVFSTFNNGLTYSATRSWEVSGWKGQSINNKPFIAIDGNGNVFVTDPDGFRILEFDSNGNFIRGWGDYSSGIDGFGMPIGIAVDAEDRVWVSDSENGFLLRFTLPGVTSLIPAGLPLLPASTSRLTYNLTTGLVDGPFQQPVYRLDVDGSHWVPIVPEGIMLLLPNDAQPMRSATGDWLLLNADGTTAFRWHRDLLLWISEDTAQPTPTE